MICIADFRIICQLIINQYKFCSMNKKLSIAYLVLSIAPLFFACSGSVKEKNNASASSVSGEQKYMIDTTQSVVIWKGSMLLGSSFVGNVYISKGELMIENGQLVGGTVELDMNTIEFEDKKRPDGPIKHLKSPDLFDTKKFPVSVFEITKVATGSSKTLKVTGNLTIKGITRAVNFPAKMEVKDGIVQVNGEMIIDRTDWGIRYSSGKFYDYKANGIISDDIKFHMKIVAKQ